MLELLALRRPVVRLVVRRLELLMVAGSRRSRDRHLVVVVVLLLLQGIHRHEGHIVIGVGPPRGGVKEMRWDRGAGEQVVGGGIGGGGGCCQPGSTCGAGG